MVSRATRCDEAVHHANSDLIQYSRAYYRATYISTSFDAGFATAMPIRPKWVRDICGVLFAGYYMIWAREADEKVGRSVLRIGDTKGSR
jgi:hypothetical protein